MTETTDAGISVTGGTEVRPPAPIGTGTARVAPGARCACGGQAARSGRVRARRRGPTRVGKASGAEAGMATAEYAIGTLAAAGIAGLLVVLLKGGDVKEMLMSLIQQALSVA